MNAITPTNPVAAAEPAGAGAPATGIVPGTLPVQGNAPTILTLDRVGKRFHREPDLAERVARLLGAKVSTVDVRALDDVSLSIAEGEVVGLVGESGCGKSTLGRIVAQINEPTSGTVSYRGRPVASLRGAEARQAQLQIQMVFQDPMASLNPRMRVEDIIGEAPVFHGLVPRREMRDYVADLMRKVGLDPTYGRRYPHQFSGGQRQRVGIARALAVRPELLVCDESVAALDVSIQAQIINLFMQLRAELSLTYLFISHDLGVVEHIADRTVIMYLGRVVEVAPTPELFDAPAHPYAQALLAEAPRVSTTRRIFAPLKGEMPSPLAPPPGCAFHPRCPQAMPRCKVERPELLPVAPGRLAACHLHDRN